MSSIKNELLGWLAWSSVNLAAPWLVDELQIKGPLMYLLRFIWLASGLRALLHLESARILQLGRDLESPESSRDLFKLALIYTGAMILMAAGGLSLIL